MIRETSILSRIASFENLNLAADNCKTCRRYQQDVLEFKSDYASNIFSLRDEMLSNVYETGPYHAHYIYIPTWRLLQYPPYRDRVAQQAIFQILGPILDKQYIYHSYACRVGKGTLKAAQIVQYWLAMVSRKPDAAKWCAAKLDVAKFFYRIDHGVAEDILSRYVDDTAFMDMAHRIICCKHTPFGLPEGKSCREVAPEDRLFDVGVPIGSRMSQTLANMVMNEADQYAKHVLGIRFFARYNDDVIILSNDTSQLKEWLLALEEFIYTHLKLRCNKKTAIIPLSHGIPFVGKRIWATHMLFRKSTVKHTKRSLIHLAEEYAAGKVDVDYVVQVLASYFGMLKHYDSYTIREWISENIVFRRDSSIIPDVVSRLDDVQSEEWESEAFAY